MFGILLSRINNEIDELITKLQMKIENRWSKNPKFKNLTILLNRSTIKVIVCRIC